MIIYVTKYAFKKGIVAVEGEILERGMVRITWDGHFYDYLHHEGKDWARTESEARDIVKTMQAKRIISLSKQLEKLRNLEVKVRHL